MKANTFFCKPKWAEDINDHSYNILTFDLLELNQFDNLFNFNQ